MSNNNNNKPASNGPRPEPSGYGKTLPTATERYKVKKKRSPMFKFFVVLTSTIAVVFLLATAAIVGYTYMVGSKETVGDDDEVAQPKSFIDTVVDSVQSIGNLFTGIPQRTNFLILGIDDDGQSSRSDVMMLGCFNAETTELSLISIPRDTYITLSDTHRQELIDLGRKNMPKSMKINEIYNHAGKKYGAEYAVKHVEEMLGISIPFYVAVKFDGFLYIVDEIGGVYFDVPEAMVYEDPYQDLHINIKPGYQILKGDTAIGFVRYRSYPQADLRRVKNQQAFIVAALTQALAKDSLLQNAGALLEMVYNYVETNIPLTEAIKYISYIKDINEESIHTYTLPYDPNRVGDYVYLDEVKAYELIQEVFYNNGGSVVGTPSPEPSGSPLSSVSPAPSDNPSPTENPALTQSPTVTDTTPALSETGPSPALYNPPPGATGGN